jgi:hypothetical protein
MLDMEADGERLKNITHSVTVGELIVAFLSEPAKGQAAARWLAYASGSRSKNITA